MVIMGDFNAVIDRGLAKSNIGTTHSIIPQLFRNWLVNKGLNDIWLTIIAS